MKIILTGVETNNKGAELMLYAILQEIERSYPDAIVYLADERIHQGISYISTRVDFRILPFSRIEKKLRLNALYWFLRIPYGLMPHCLATGRIDYVLDGSGFGFSDQFNTPSKYVKLLKKQLSFYQRKRTKVVYLPQAFGPFKKELSKEILSVISHYSSLLMPRERVSYEYLKESRVVNMEKVKLFTDFTSLVSGVFPNKYNHLKGGVCIIPNVQMINKGMISYDDYVSLLEAIINEGNNSGRPVYLLNHEGKKDEQFCYRCQKSICDSIVVVTGLNALEVKGLISSAYIVVSSRFHGLASALNSCVPCLATSWSHKYKELFDDYGIKDGVLPLDDNSKAIEMMKHLLDETNNNSIRELLSSRVPIIKKTTREMWDTVWTCK